MLMGLTFPLVCLQLNKQSNRIANRNYLPLASMVDYEITLKQLVEATTKNNNIPDWFEFGIVKASQIDEMTLNRLYIHRLIEMQGKTWPSL